MTSHGEPADAPSRTNDVQDSHGPNHPQPENTGASPTRTSRAAKLALVAIVLLHITLSIVGITWGLPNRSIDKYLFGNEQPWSGEKIYRLANATDKFSTSRGADVDADPFDTGSSHDKAIAAEDREPIPLTSTPEDVAKIYLRYRLYTYQPDEMITMMALAGMKPSQWNFDPRLYQYGGLFIYPVGALIKLCGMLGLIDVRSDVVYYLDHPEEFGKFYIVARAYSAAWGAIGVIVVFAIARGLHNAWHGQAQRRHVDSNVQGEIGIAGARIPSRTTTLSRSSTLSSFAGLLAAFLFTLMPVVVCMSHEGKPHLPGAVLMLIAVWLAMKYLETKRPVFFLYVSITCGAAVGMVLSSWPICILIPLVAWLNRNRSAILSASPSVPKADASNAASNLITTPDRWFAIAVKGTTIAITTYLVTNPYIVINIFLNREVLRSNFGNSLAMYQVSRIGEGLVRVLELTIEGATWPILILGTIAALIAIINLRSSISVRATTTPSEPPAQSGVKSEPGAQATGQHHRQRNAETASPQNPNAKAIIVLPLLIVAAVFFLQFVLIGAGKPAEYGRFGIFTNTAMAIGTSCLFGSLTASLRSRMALAAAATVMICVMGWQTFPYISNFATDARGSGSRNAIAKVICDDFRLTRNSRRIVEVRVEPAPYSCPPIPFGQIDLRLRRTTSVEQQLYAAATDVNHLMFTLDDPKVIGIHPDNIDGSFFRGSSARMLDGVVMPFPYSLSRISWANKPIGFASVSGRLGPS